MILKMAGESESSCFTSLVSLSGPVCVERSDV